jgi:cold shock protein
MNGSNGRQKGFLKFYNDEKGFGFIIPLAGGNDIFLHFSDSPGIDLGSLDRGQAVTFCLEPGRKGPNAVDVQIDRG